MKPEFGEFDFETTIVPWPSYTPDGRGPWFTVLVRHRSRKHGAGSFTLYYSSRLRRFVHSREPQRCSDKLGYGFMLGLLKMCRAKLS